MISPLSRLPSSLNKPRLGAESLHPIADPLVGAPRPDELRPPTNVPATIGAALLSPEAPVQSAPWLAPDQLVTVWRLVASVRWHGGAILAAPWGSGKTFSALTAARELPAGGPFSCVVPAEVKRPRRAVLDHIPRDPYHTSVARKHLQHATVPLVGSKRSSAVALRPRGSVRLHRRSCKESAS